MGQPDKHNYCRNPISRAFGASVLTAAASAWCYTTDPATKWDYCDIRDCTECDEGEDGPFSLNLIISYILSNSDCKGQTLS